MLPGYNTDVKHEGYLYHIQTEDNGESNPVILTLVYQGGAILARKMSDYRHLLNSGDFTKEVRKMMREQHRQIIKDIMEGNLSSLRPQEISSETTEAVKSMSLDEAIMQFLAERVE